MAGGMDTWSLKLSQYDHFTEVCTKKTLNERWHVLGDGSGVVSGTCIRRSWPSQY